MFTVNITGNSVQELKSNLTRALNELSGAPMQPELPVQPLGKSPVQDALETIDSLKGLHEPTPETFYQGPPAAPTESSIDGVNVSELDKEGRVWDERIDSPMKTKNQYGKWKAKIGVNKTDRIRIIEQLKMKPESQALPANTQEQVAAPQAVEPEIEQETPASFLPAEHMTLEHFGNNFPTVMSGLFNTGKITTERVQQLCEIARVKQAYEIPLNETSLKAVYNNLIQVGLI
jgi:hypothetical protein